MNEEINGIINGYTPITLNEMDNVQFMNRTDTKYVFPIHKLYDILKQASNKYRILEISNQRIFSYNSTYLDTSDYLFFYQQATGKMQRHKVRYRIYESTGVSYLEIKRKTNKNRTIKWRIKNCFDNTSCNDEAINFLKEYIPDECCNLRPVLTNMFSRMTLVGLETLERITIDCNLSFSNENGQHIKMPFLAIAELKREGFTNQSPFIHIMKQNNIRQTGFSKYCIGSALFYDVPHKIIMKQKYLLLNKIENEYNAFYNR
jgi:hypothetical protein